jgi:transposase
MTIRLREMTDEEVETIQRWANSRTAEARLVERAKIIRVAREGKRGKAVAEEVGLNPATVRKWLKRFNETGFAGLRDAERPGKPPRYTPGQVGEVVATALTNPSTLGLPVASWTLDRLDVYLSTLRKKFVRLFGRLQNTGTSIVILFSGVAVVVTSLCAAAASAYAQMYPELTGCAN